MRESLDFETVVGDDSAGGSELRSTHRESKGENYKSWDPAKGQGFSNQVVDGNWGWAHAKTIRSSCSLKEQRIIDLITCSLRHGNNLGPIPSTHWGKIRHQKGGRSQVKD